jgi:hypothetical protein
MACILGEQAVTLLKHLFAAILSWNAWSMFHAAGWIKRPLVNSWQFFLDFLLDLFVI